MIFSYFLTFIFAYFLCHFMGYLKGERKGIRQAVLRHEAEMGISEAMNKWRKERA